MCMFDNILCDLSSLLHYQAWPVSISDHLSLVQMQTGTCTAGCAAGGEGHAWQHTFPHSRCYVTGITGVDAAADKDV